MGQKMKKNEKLYTLLHQKRIRKTTEARKLLDLGQKSDTRACELEQLQL